MMEILDYLKARYMGEKAQGMVEYALIIAFVVIIAAALTTSGSLKDAITGAFNSVKTTITSMQ